MKSKFLALLLISFLLVGCTQTPNEKPLETQESSIEQWEPIKHVRILSNNIDVKEGAGDTFKTIGNLNKNQIADVLGQVGDWYVVQLDNNRVGCVQADPNKVKPVIKEGAEGAAPSQPYASQQPNGQPKRTPQQTENPPQEAERENQPERNPNVTPAPTPTPEPTPTPAPERQPEQNAPADNDRSPAAPVQRLSDQEQRMVELVNSERTKNGLPALTIDLEVARVARVKSQDMVDNNYFSHNSPTYGSPFDMMKSFGIEYLHAGENLAGNQTVDKAHTALMNSSGHRKNILNQDFTHIGIGVKASDRYGYIYTQMFISKPK